jgi:hypothetical protein
VTETDWTTTASSSFRRLLRLTALSSRALDDAFSYGSPGVIPDKAATGIGLAWTGTWISRPLAYVFRLFWKGKIFDRRSSKVINRILPFGMPAIHATVGAGNSLFDGRPCVVIDYSCHRLIGRMVRDEIREIEPGMYLGLVYLLGRRVMKFALTEDRGD